MRIVCVYTKQITEHRRYAERCVASAKSFGYDVELYESIWKRDVMQELKQFELKSKYNIYENVPVWTDKMEERCKTYGVTFLQTNGCTPERLANGITHYKLYLESVENNEPLCILESRATFVDNLPPARKNGVIQISSHTSHQMDEGTKICTRANKMKYFEHEKWQQMNEQPWPTEADIIQHPLTGLQGTSGYIIGPNAAKKMIQYIKKDGVAFADRVRPEHIGVNNLWLQVPQSILRL